MLSLHRAIRPYRSREVPENFQKFDFFNRGYPDEICIIMKIFEKIEKTFFAQKNQRQCGQLEFHVRFTKFALKVLENAFWSNFIRVCSRFELFLKFLNLFLKTHRFQIFPPFSIVVGLLVCQKAAQLDVFCDLKKSGNEMITFRVFRHFRILSDHWSGRWNFEKRTTPACSAYPVWLFWMDAALSDNATLRNPTRS